jgi:hypothetical protein
MKSLPPAKDVGCTTPGLLIVSDIRQVILVDEVLKGGGLQLDIIYV